MKTNEEILTEVRTVLISKRYSVQCQYCGVVRESEIDRANAQGEAELAKPISDATILAAVIDCQEAGSENAIVDNVLGVLAEHDFKTYYDSIIFVVNVW